MAVELVFFLLAVLAVEMIRMKNFAFKLDVTFVDDTVTFETNVFTQTCSFFFGVTVST